MLALVSRSRPLAFVRAPSSAMRGPRADVDGVVPFDVMMARMMRVSVPPCAVQRSAEPESDATIAAEHNASATTRSDRRDAYN